MCMCKRARRERREELAEEPNAVLQLRHLLIARSHRHSLISMLEEMSIAAAKDVVFVLFAPDPSVIRLSPDAPQRPVAERGRVVALLKPAGCRRENFLAVVNRQSTFDVR